MLVIISNGDGRSSRRWIEEKNAKEMGEELSSQREYTVEKVVMSFHLLSCLLDDDLSS